MKKTLIAAAVMAASGVAFAASNVTLYGVLEEGVVVQKGKHFDTNVQLKSGFVAGNRWGIKGVEDLGNGYTVGFILEQGFDSDTGAEAESTQAFSRESILYVNGNYGSLAFGRTGGLAFAQSRAIRTGWVFGTSYGASSWNNYAWVAKRMNNVISYATPAFGGFSVHAMYSNSGTGNTSNDLDKWSKNGHYYGIGVKYQADAIKSSLIFEAAQNKNLPVTSNRNAKYGINYGLEWNLGAITPMFGYQYVWQDKGNKDHQFGLSAQAPVAGGTAMLGARYLFGKDDGAAAGKEDKHNVFTIGAGYAYPLSKRTKINSYAGYAHSGKAWKETEFFKSSSVGMDKAPNYSGYQLFIGLQHNF